MTSAVSCALFTRDICSCAIVFINSSSSSIGLVKGAVYMVLEETLLAELTISKLLPTTSICTDIIFSVLTALIVIIIIIIIFVISFIGRNRKAVNFIISIILVVVALAVLLDMKTVLVFYLPLRLSVGVIVVAGRALLLLCIHV